MMLSLIDVLAKANIKVKLVDDRLLAGPKSSIDDIAAEFIRLNKVAIIKELRCRACQWYGVLYDDDNDKGCLSGEACPYE